MSILPHKASTCARIIFGLLGLILLVLYCYSIPNVLSPTEEWQKTYAPWFGVPAKVLSLDKKTHLYLQDYTVESHYVLELSDAEADSWESRLKSSGVDVGDKPQGFSVAFLFALEGPDGLIKVNDFNLQRRSSTSVAGHGIYALDIEYGDWDSDDIPKLELAYPEYLEFVVENNPIRSSFPVILLMSMSLVMFIWPSIWRDSFGVMILKAAPLCAVVSFVLIVVGTVENPGENLNFLYVSFFCYAIVLTIVLVLLASFVCALRFLCAKFRQGSSRNSF